MSTCIVELRRLQKDLHHHGVKVSYVIDETGTIACAFIVGKGVRKEYWDNPLSAAEYMRRILREKEITRDYGHSYPHKGQYFSNGRWRLEGSNP